MWPFLLWNMPRRIIRVPVHVHPCWTQNKLSLIPFKIRAVFSFKNVHSERESERDRDRRGGGGRMRDRLVQANLEFSRVSCPKLPAGMTGYEHPLLETYSSGTQNLSQQVLTLHYLSLSPFVQLWTVYHCTRSLARVPPCLRSLVYAYLYPVLLTNYSSSR